MLTNPADILAAIPSLLGFYPQESLVIVFFHCELIDDQPQFSLGPTIRCDLDDADALTELRTLDLGVDNHDLAFAFIISPRVSAFTRPMPMTKAIAEDLDPIIRVVEDLMSLADDPTCDKHVDACWAAESISVGELYSLVFTAVDPDTLADAWCQGEIGEVVSSAAIDPWVEAGRLPEASRGEVMSRFDPERSPLGVEDQWFLYEYAREAASGELNIPWLIGDLEEFLDDPLARDEGFALALGATICGNIEARDAALAPFLERPEEAAEWALVLAQSLSGEARANALCLYAAACLGSRLPVDAVPALLTAGQEQPHHTLTALMLGALLEGKYNELREALRDGSLHARRGGWE